MPPPIMARVKGFSWTEEGVGVVTAVEGEGGVGVSDLVLEAVDDVPIFRGIWFTIWVLEVGVCLVIDPHARFCELIIGRR